MFTTMGTAARRPPADLPAQPQARGCPWASRLRAAQLAEEGTRDPPGATGPHPCRPHPATVGFELRVRKPDSRGTPRNQLRTRRDAGIGTRAPSPGRSSPGPAGLDLLAGTSNAAGSLDRCPRWPRTPADRWRSVSAVAGG